MVGVTAGRGHEAEEGRHRAGRQAERVQRARATAAAALCMIRFITRSFRMMIIVGLILLERFVWRFELSFGVFGGGPGELLIQQTDDVAVLTHPPERRIGEDQLDTVVLDDQLAELDQKVDAVVA